MRQFDQLSWYALDMIQTKISKVWRFLSRLHPGLAGLVDTWRDGPESYTDVVGCEIRQESWAKTDKSLNLVLAVHRKKSYNRIHFRWWEVNVVVDGLGSRKGGPIIKTSLTDPVGSLKHEVNGRVGQGIKVDQNSLGEVNRLDEILSNDHYVTSAKGDI